MTTNNTISNPEKLANLVNSKSKHSDYQLLHPLLRPLINNEYKPSGKSELERQQYMSKLLPTKGLKILDIGANTGYFSFAAIAEGAEKVVCIEGNAEHANFINDAATYLGMNDKISAQNTYFNFKNGLDEKFDTVLCLNVLHHLGDDFGDQSLQIDQAKKEMIENLNLLAKHTTKLWLQIGFNWKGDRSLPLFQNGTKSELIDFIRSETSKHWSIDDISVYNPNYFSYTQADSDNLIRIDSIGEFLNRPLFLMTSKVD